jgi:hypothetical protein
LARLADEEQRERQRRRREDAEVERQRREAERLRVEAEREKERRDRQEKERAVREAAERKAEQERQEAIKREQERKADLEGRGLPYYPKPTTLYGGKNAEQWYQQAVANPLNSIIQEQTASALVALKEEGMQFLIMFLEKATNPQGVDLILNLIAPEYVHANDLPKIVNCLDKKRANPSTRMLALRYLRKRQEAKAHVERIEALVADLKASPKYQADVKEALEAIKSAE